jgi:hypothetical protein
MTGFAIQTVWCVITVSALEVEDYLGLEVSLIYSWYVVQFEFPEYLKYIVYSCNPLPWNQNYPHVVTGLWLVTTKGMAPGSSAIPVAMNTTFRVHSQPRQAVPGGSKAHTGK